MLKTGLKTYQNSDLNEIKELLAPHTKRAYLVGGYVRDKLLGKHSYDYDIEIYDIAPDKFNTLMEKIGASGVGKSYFIYKFKHFDLGLPRMENKIGVRHQDFEVSYCNDERMASMRRDFTINAMMINIFDGTLLDFWGGARDLKNGVLRHIDDDKFCEDALRVLRAVQFSARLNFSIEPKTLELMKTLDLSYLSKSRISAELVKFFKAEFLEVGAEYLFRLNLLEKFFGEFDDGEFYGLKISKNEFDKFKNLLKSARKFISNEHLFFYLFCGYFCLDCEQNARNLGLAKSYERLDKEPYFKDNVSKKELMQIALLKPLNSWLGCYDGRRVKMARELGIYENKFEPDVNMSEILSLGLKGDRIGKEIKRRQNLAIDEYLKEKCV